MEAGRREFQLIGIEKSPKYENVALLIWSSYELGKSKQEIANMLIDKGLSQGVAMTYVEKFMASISKNYDVYGSLLI
jgi:hypothetical protein